MATMLVIAECPIDHKQSHLFVDKEAFFAWVNKEKFIQDAFPDSSPELRETLMTGMCKACQEFVFNEEEDD